MVMSLFGLLSKEILMELWVEGIIMAVGGTCGWWCKSCTKGRILDVDDKHMNRMYISKKLDDKHINKQPHSEWFCCSGFQDIYNMNCSCCLQVATWKKKLMLDVCFPHFFRPQETFHDNSAKGGGGLIWLSEVSIRYIITLPEANIAPQNGWLEYYFPFGFSAYFQGPTV